MGLLTSMMFSLQNFVGTSFKSATTGSITLPATSSLNLSGTFTIEGWMYALNTTASIPFTKVGANYQYQAEWGASGLMFYITTVEGGFYLINVAAPVGEWFYFAFTVNVPAGRATMRINNTVSTRTDITGTHYTTSNAGVISSSSSPFQGYYDEIRLWNIERTQSDLTASKDSALMGIESGLVGYYKMDNNANNSCLTTGATNHATMTGGTWDSLIAPVSQS